MGASNPTPLIEQDWQAGSDARTLIEAEKIKGDPDRVARAQAHARMKADEAAEMQKSLEKPAETEGALDLLKHGFRRIP